jgi:hypothetical protein
MIRKRPQTIGELKMFKHFQYVLCTAGLALSLNSAPSHSSHFYYVNDLFSGVRLPELVEHCRHGYTSRYYRHHHHSCTENRRSGRVRYNSVLTVRVNTAAANDRASGSLDHFGGNIKAVQQKYPGGSYVLVTP